MKTGFKQGDVNAPMLFNLFMDTVVRCLLPMLKQSGIRFVYKLDGQLREFKSRNIQDIVWVFMYADDIVIFAESEAQMQAALDLTDETFARWGLEIIIKKTKAMGIGCSEPFPAFHLARGEIETVDAFKYLGRFASSDATLHREISQRLSNAGHAYHRLDKLWKDNHLALSIKLAVYKTVVLASMLYGAETWPWTRTTIKPLATFHMRCLRRLCGVSMWQRKENKESVETLLRFRRLRWLGHMARMRDVQIPKQLVFGNLCNSADRGPGRPHKPAGLRS